MKNSIFLCLFILVGCTRVMPGYEGIKVNLCAGDEKSSVERLPIGRHFEGWCKNIYTYPLYKVRYVFTKSPDEGSSSNEEICANDIDGMQHCFDVGIVVRTIKGKSPQVFSSFCSYGDDITGIVKGPAFDILRDSMNQVIRSYKSSEVYATKKGEIRDLVLKMFNVRLSKDGLTIDELTFNAYRPPTSVRKAIEAKVRVDEESAKVRAEAERVRAEEVKRTIIETEQAARAKIKADADAYVTTTTAEAQAKANERVSKSLTKELLEYKKWQKWNGNFPKVLGNNSTLLNLN